MGSPAAPTCSTDVVSLSGILEPAYTIGGDAFDFAVNPNRVEFAIVDAVGHGTSAVSMSTAAVTSLRNARREGSDIVDKSYVGELSCAPSLPMGLLPGWIRRAAERVAVQARCSSDEATDLMVERADDERCSLGDLALAVVEGRIIFDASPRRQ